MLFDRFVFDSVNCDEYGVFCANFNSQTLSTYESQKTDLQQEKSSGSDIFHIVSQDYSEPLVYTIQIMNRDYSPITTTEERALNKWLCRRGKYSLFCILDKRYADIWFYANFSNPKTIVINDVNGLEYTVTTNAPYAFSDERDITVTFDGGDTFERYVDNDEELTVMPDMDITVNQGGELKITNQSSDGSDNCFSIKNCVAGEKITVTADYPIIESSISSHNVYNDFNKNWFYFIDGYNTVHSNLACSIRFVYRERRKVGIV